MGLLTRTCRLARAARQLGAPLRALVIAASVVVSAPAAVRSGALERHKLFGVVLLTTLVALLVSLLVSLGTVITDDLRAYHRNLLADMSTQAELLGHMSAAALAFDDQRLATGNLDLLRIRPKVGAGVI